MERLLSVAEVQEVLNLSRSKTYELIASGELSAVRFGRSLRVPPENLRELIQKKIEA